MDDFNRKCFEYLENGEYSGNAFDVLVVDMIDLGVQYLRTLDDSFLSQFKIIEDKLNGINYALTGDNKFYGQKFLDFYKAYYNIEQY